MGVAHYSLLLAVPLLLATLTSCSPQKMDACKELHEEYSRDSVILARSESECSRLLDFFRSEKFGKNDPSPNEWLDQVVDQKIKIMFGVRDALISIRGPLGGLKEDFQEWAPESFDIAPASLPCGGLAMSEETPWKLSELGIAKPNRLLVQASLELGNRDDSTAGQYAVIKLYQDHNCDGVLGVTTMKGTYIRGIFPEQGGWLKDGMIDSAPLYE